MCRLDVCHPGLINMLQAHCRNCLILLWALSPTALEHKNTEKQKVAGWGVASWEHTGLSSMSSFHASFIHFITSLDECEGVEEKPCYSETEKEEPHSIFSSPGPALPSACSLHAWITLLQGVWGCELPYEHTTSGDTRHTWFAMRDSWMWGKMRKHGGECIFLYYLYAYNWWQMSPTSDVNFSILISVYSIHIWALLLVCCSLRQICHLWFCAVYWQKKLTRCPVTFKTRH